MQDYLPIIQSNLSDWLQLTLANPWYAAALIIGVFLLTAIVFGIRIAILKRKYAASESARTQLQNNLALSQQHLNEIKEQLAQRGQKMAGTMQALAKSFDLGEEPIAADDYNSDALWQQHDRVISLLANRLLGEQKARIELQQSYQAETTKRIEKEAMVESLQSALADKTGLVSRLEIALQEQKSLLLEEQEKAQHILAQIVEKHMAESDRLAELEQQALEWANSKIQLAQLEEKLHVKEAAMTPLQTETAAVPIDIPPIHLDVESDTQEIRDTEFTQETIILPDWEVNAESPSLSVPEIQPTAPGKEPASGLGGKIKNLFVKSKSQPIAEVEEAAAIEPAAAEIEPEPVIENEPSVGSDQSRLGKIKNLFGKAKQERTAETETQPTAQTAVETQSETENENRTSESLAKGQIKKFRNLFATKK